MENLTLTIDWTEQDYQVSDLYENLQVDAQLEQEAIADFESKGGEI